MEDEYLLFKNEFARLGYVEGRNFVFLSEIRGWQQRTGCDSGNRIGAFKR